MRTAVATGIGFANKLAARNHGNQSDGWSRWSPSSSEYDGKATKTRRILRALELTLGGIGELRADTVRTE